MARYIKKFKIWTHTFRRKEHDKLGNQDSSVHTQSAFVTGTCSDEKDSFYDTCDVPVVSPKDGGILNPEVYQRKTTFFGYFTSATSIIKRKMDKSKEHFRKIFEDAVRREYQAEQLDLDEVKSYVTISPKQTMEIISNRGDPVTPGMESYEARISSFKNWPLGNDNDVTKTAAAGFFHQGIKCNGECYYCGLAIFDWVDPPDVEHIQWSPMCRFVRSHYSAERIRHILFQRIYLPSGLKESKTVCWPDLFEAYQNTEDNTDVDDLTKAAPSADDDTVPTSMPSEKFQVVIDTQGNSLATTRVPHNEVVVNGGDSKHLPHNELEVNCGDSKHLPHNEVEVNCGDSKHLPHNEVEVNCGDSKHLPRNEVEVSYGDSKHLNVPHNEVEVNCGDSKHLPHNEVEVNCGDSKHLNVPHNEVEVSCGDSKHLPHNVVEGNHGATNNLPHEEVEGNHRATNHLPTEEAKGNCGGPKHLQHNLVDGNLLRATNHVPLEEVEGNCGGPKHVPPKEVEGRCEGIKDLQPEETEEKGGGTRHLPPNKGEGNYWATKNIHVPLEDVEGNCGVVVRDL